MDDAAMTQETEMGAEARVETEQKTSVDKEKLKEAIDAVVMGTIDDNDNYNDNDNDNAGKEHSEHSRNCLFFMFNFFQFVKLKKKKA